MIVFILEYQQPNRRVGWKKRVSLDIFSYFLRIKSCVDDERFSKRISMSRECVRNLDLRVQVHPGELWVSKQRVHVVLEASKSAGAKGDVPKICGFVHPLYLL